MAAEPSPGESRFIFSKRLYIFSTFCLRFDIAPEAIGAGAAAAAPMLLRLIWLRIVLWGRLGIVGMLIV